MDSRNVETSVDVDRRPMRQTGSSRPIAPSIGNTSPRRRRHVVQGGEERPVIQSAEGFCEAELPALVKMLTLRVGNRWVAEDLAQEALARALGDWDHVRATRNPSNHVYRIAVRLASSTVRRRRSERKAMRRARTEAQAQLAEPESDDQSELLELLKNLTRREREVLSLRYGADLSVQATAETLGVTEGTVKTLSHRGLAKLRRTVELDRSDDLNRTDELGLTHD